MIDWVLKIIEKITRAIFHWSWRVQTHRKWKRKNACKIRVQINSVHLRISSDEHSGPDQDPV